MKINGLEIKGKYFAYNGCHKIYIIEDEEDLQKAKKAEYRILPIEKIEETYNASCELKFISNWKLDKKFVKQYGKATFEY